VLEQRSGTGVLRWAVSWFNDRRVRVERVQSDNGPAYRSHVWREVCTGFAITAKRDPALPTADQRQGARLGLVGA